MAKKKKAKRKEIHTKKRAAIYCRVSTFDQNRGDYSSLEDQATRLQRTAEEDGYEVFQIYKEVASSANLERDELRKMLSNIDDFDIIYVTKLDRLSRSMHDWCKLNELLDKKDVALVSTTQKIDTTTPMGRFFRDLLMLFAQFEREMIAERTYEKMFEHARQGKWSGGHPILGYDSEDKKLIVNPEQAELVNKIFDKYLELASIAKTTRWVNLQGYRTKYKKFANGREVKPRKFNRADIQRSLSNITYIGKIRFDETEYIGEHEGIVPEEKFLEVQKLLAAKKEKPRRGDQKQKVTLLLGLLRCDYCGGAYTSSFVNKKNAKGEIKRYYYYKCSTKLHREAKACKGADLRAEIIDNVLVSYFRQLSKEPKKLKAVLKAAEANSKKGSKELETERSNFSNQLTKIEQDAMTLVDRLADPELKNMNSIKKRLTSLDQEQKVLQSKITDLTLQIRDRQNQNLSADEIKAAYEQFDELWEELTFEERQYALRLLIKQIDLKFEKGKKEGEVKITAWGRSPKPLNIRLRDFRTGKLRNQDVWHTPVDSND